MRQRLCDDEGTLAIDDAEKLTMKIEGRVDLSLRGLSRDRLPTLISRELSRMLAKTTACFPWISELLL